MVPRWRAQSLKVDQELAQRSATIFEMAGGEFNINSPKQLRGRFSSTSCNLPVLKTDRDLEGALDCGGKCSRKLAADA